MKKTPEMKKHGDSCCAVDFGPFQDLNDYGSALPGVPAKVESKIFIKELLELTSTEISINKMPPGQVLPTHHKHQMNEEVYIFIGGEGEFQVDGIIFDVTEGSVVRVGPAGERSWRNTGSKDLLYIVVQAREGSYDQGGLMDRVPLIRQW